MDEGAPVGDTHFLGQLSASTQEVVGDVAEDDPAGVTQQGQGAEADQAVTRPDVEQGLAVLWSGAP
jgi:hypothetical protein